MPVYRHVRTRTHNHLHCQIISVQWILLHIPKKCLQKVCRNVWIDQFLEF